MRVLTCAIAKRLLAGPADLAWVSTARADVYGAP
jgi:hypothetical protein